MAGGERKNTRSSSVNKEPDKNKDKDCNKCKKGFTTPGERSMNCDMCGYWFHGKCTKLSDALIKEIDSIDQIKWFCESCQSSATGVLSQILKIQKDQQNTEAALNALIKRYDEHIDDCSELIIKTIDDKIETQIEEKVATTIQETLDEDTIEAKLTESITKAVSIKLQSIDIDKKIDEKLDALIPKEKTELPSLQTSFAALLKQPGEAQSNLFKVVRDEVKGEVSEQKQIEALRMNLVITGIPERQNPEAEIQEVITLFEKELNITPDIHKTERIGKSKENDPRLLRVTFITMRSRREVLVNSINLRNSVNKSVRDKIFVRPDMTENQRKESKNLRELLRKMKKDNPNKSYMIKRNQVVEKPASPAVPTQ